jgi:hypothetical protein
MNNEVGDLVRQIELLRRRASAAEERLTALEKVGDKPVEKPSKVKITMEYIKKVVIDKYPDFKFISNQGESYEIACNSREYWVSSDSEGVWIMAYNSIVGYDNALPLDYFDNE